MPSINVADDHRMFVNVRRDKAQWAVKGQNGIVARGQCDSLEKVRDTQQDWKIRSVIIDAGFRTQEVEEAAFEFGWYTYKGKAGTMSELDEIFSPDVPQGQDFYRGFMAAATEVHATAKEKGWWDKERNDGEIIALMHSELSEALEALRQGNPADDKIPQFTGVEAELADVVIRIMDMAVARQWRIAEAVLEKIAMNKTRERMHGGKLF